MTVIKIKNCVSCYIKAGLGSTICPCMNTEPKKYDECFAWVKDRAEWNRRASDIKKYGNKVLYMNIKMPYTCPKCKRMFLDYQHPEHTCKHCHNHFLSNKRKKGDSDGEE